MGRPRKTTSSSTGKISNIEKHRRAKQEQEIKSGINAFLKAPSWLIDDVARYEYKKSAQDLISLNLASDLDKNALGAYANSYARYRQILKELEGQPLIINGKANPLCALEQQYMREMRTNADRCGISLNARLKVAEINSKKSSHTIEAKFGDI